MGLFLMSSLLMSSSPMPSSLLSSSLLSSLPVLTFADPQYGIRNPQLLRAARRSCG
jgi:hypothetical protein